MAEEGPRIERDGGCIKLISNENTYIIIDKDKIIIKGTVVIDGILKNTVAAAGATCGTSISVVKNGVIAGIY